MSGNRIRWPKYIHGKVRTAGWYCHNKPMTTYVEVQETCVLFCRDCQLMLTVRGEEILDQKQQSSSPAGRTRQLVISV